MYSLMRLVDLRDPQMNSHAHAVSDLATAIAAALGLDEQAVLLITTSRLLHDFGKIAIPDVLLTKEAHLSPQEWAIISQHPDFDARILEASPALRDLAICSIGRQKHSRS